MRKLSKLGKAATIGLLSGIILTVFLKFVETTTHYRVYTLLLNVDYIPYLNRFQFPELLEISFHLVVSMALSILIYLFIDCLQFSSNLKIILLCITICTSIGVLLFPTTALSTQTPAITSIPSFFYWLLGHVVFGFTLGILFTKRT